MFDKLFKVSFFLLILSGSVVKASCLVEALEHPNLRQKCLGILYGAYQKNPSFLSQDEGRELWSIQNYITKSQSHPKTAPLKTETTSCNIQKKAKIQTTEKEQPVQIVKKQSINVIEPLSTGGENPLNSQLQGTHVLLDQFNKAWDPLVEKNLIAVFSDLQKTLRSTLEKCLQANEEQKQAKSVITASANKKPERAKVVRRRPPSKNVKNEVLKSEPQNIVEKKEVVEKKGVVETTRGRNLSVSSASSREKSQSQKSQSRSKSRPRKIEKSQEKL